MLKNRAREWEVRTYPEETKHEFWTDEFTCDAPDEGREEAYIYFGPAFHIRKKLVTLGIIKHMISDESVQMLSVGAGGAHLERFLVEEMGIPISQIFLSDKYVGDMPKGFTVHQFDHTIEWPREVGEFDYIIFPASINFGVYTSYNGTAEVQETYDSDLLVTCVENAYPHLKSGGQIRISDHVLSKQVIRDARARISAAHPDLRLLALRNLGDSIVVRKG